MPALPLLLTTLMVSAAWGQMLLASPRGLYKRQAEVEERYSPDTQATQVRYTSAPQTVRYQVPEATQVRYQTAPEAQVRYQVAPEAAQVRYQTAPEAAQVRYQVAPEAGQVRYQAASAGTVRLTADEAARYRAAVEAAQLPAPESGITYSPAGTTSVRYQPQVQDGPPQYVVPNRPRAQPQQVPGEYISLLQQLQAHSGLPVQQVDPNDVQQLLITRTQQIQAGISSQRQASPEVEQQRRLQAAIVERPLREQAEADVRRAQGLPPLRPARPQPQPQYYQEIPNQQLPASFYKLADSQTQQAARQQVAQQQAAAERQALAEQQASAQRQAIAEQQAAAERQALAEQQAAAQRQAIAEQQAAAERQALAEQQAAAQRQAIAEQQAAAEQRALAQQQAAAEQRALAQQQAAAEQRALAHQQALAQQQALSQAPQNSQAESYSVPDGVSYSQIQFGSTKLPRQRVVKIAAPKQVIYATPAPQSYPSQELVFAAPQSPQTPQQYLIETSKPVQEYATPAPSRSAIFVTQSSQDKEVDVSQDLEGLYQTTPQPDFVTAYSVSPQRTYFRATAKRPVKKVPRPVLLTQAERRALSQAGIRNVYRIEPSANQDSSVTYVLAIDSKKEDKAEQ